MSLTPTFYLNYCPALRTNPTLAPRTPSTRTDTGSRTQFLVAVNAPIICISATCPTSSLSSDFEEKLKIAGWSGRLRPEERPGAVSRLACVTTPAPSAVRPQQSDGGGEAEVAQCP